MAAALELDGDTIRQARVVLGGVAHMPWRTRDVEAALSGKRVSEETFQQRAAPDASSRSDLQGLLTGIEQ